MKKHAVALIALLFVTLLAFGQAFTYRDPTLGSRLRGPTPAPAIIITALSSNSATTAFLNVTSTTALSAHGNCLIICAAYSSGGTYPTNVQGLGLTWVKITETNYNANGNFMSIWRSMTNATTPVGIVSNMYAAATSGGAIRVLEITNVMLTGANGADAIVQVLKGTNATANPTITLASLGAGGTNAVLAFFGNVANGFGGTAEAGWVEAWDQGYNNPASGQYLEWQIAGADTTPTVTVAAQQWGAIAFEVASITNSP